LNFVTTTGTHASAVSFKGRTITSYSAGARTKRTGVVARFGKLGQIDLAFEPSGPPSERPLSFCHGGKALTWEGVFTGTVVIRGRYGFPSFRDRSFRTKGSLTHRPRWVCQLPTEFEPPPSQHGNRVRLWAGACDGRGVSVESERPRAAANSDQPPEPISYSASASLRIGRVQVEQSITRSAAPGTFTFDEALTTATVGPPAPFHGNATLVRAADGSTTWSGTLSARILGRRIDLAGPAFQSGLESFPKSSGILDAFRSNVDCAGD
jgi:hypothetical protein